MVYLFERITVSVCFAFHGHICHRNLLLDQDHNFSLLFGWILYGYSREKLHVNYV